MEELFCTIVNVSFRFVCFSVTGLPLLLQDALTLPYTEGRTAAAAVNPYEPLSDTLQFMWSTENSWQVCVCVCVFRGRSL